MSDEERVITIEYTDRQHTRRFYEAIGWNFVWESQDDGSSCLVGKYCGTTLKLCPRKHPGPNEPISAPIPRQDPLRVPVRDLLLVATTLQRLGVTTERVEREYHVIDPDRNPIHIFRAAS